MYFVFFNLIPLLSPIVSNSNCITQLTIAIPVKNEESNLAACLQAISSDFVVVL